MLADDAVAYITGPDGEPMVLNGASADIAALETMHLADVDYSVTLTQAPVMVGDDQVLIMVEVRAEARGEDAAQLRRPPVADR